MDHCTHEVRAEYWKGILQACAQRPVGQSAKSWMEEKGICEQSYYHWQRKFRKQTYELMCNEEVTAPAPVPNTGISFTELPFHLPPQRPEEIENTSGSPVAVIQTASVRIEVADHIPDTILACILREVLHA